MSGKDSLQIAMAVASCRFSRQLLHRLNRGGTSLPGKLAMWFRRDILAITSEGVETILVTGTNGKTTTAAMLSHAMEEAGRGGDYSGNGYQWKDHDSCNAVPRNGRSWKSTSV